jgi:ankyrin repeat protein
LAHCFEKKIMHYRKGDRMNVSRSLFLCIVYCVHSVSTTVSCASSDYAFDKRVTTLVAQYNKNYVTYRDGNLLLYARNHTTDPGYTQLLVALGVGVGIAGGCAYYGKQHNDMKLALAGIPLALLGAYATKKFIDVLINADNNVRYLTFDREGLLVYDVRCFAWKDVAYRIESVSLPYQENTTVRKIVFADSSHDNLFELYETSLFLPMLFDDFIKVVECYYTAYGKKDAIQEVAVGKKATEQPEESQYRVEPPLVEACLQGNYTEVKRLLELGTPVDQQDSAGYPVFIIAARNGYSEIVKLFLEAHVDVDTQDASCETALIMAANRGYRDIVEILINAHANVNAQSTLGYTPLRLAAYRGHTEIVKLLLAAHADSSLKDKEGKAAYDYAANDEIKELLHQYEAQNNVSEQAAAQTPEQPSAAQPPAEQTTPEYVSTPLIDACKEGDTAEVKRLLKLGVDVNQTDSDGNTALIIATVEGYAGLVKLLLAAHANPDLQNSSGVTALMAAVCKNNQTVLRLLLDAHANPNIPNKKLSWEQNKFFSMSQNEETPLMMAVRFGYEHVARLLINARADVNLKGHNETTALMLASKYGTCKFTDLLIAAGADVNAQDKWGEAALYYATLDGYTEIVKSLLNAGANPNMQDTEGNSILKKASGLGHLEIVKLLLAANADVSVKNKLGVTAARCAATDEIAEIIQRNTGPSSPDSQQHETVAQQDQQQKDTNLQPLLDACDQGDIVKVQKLLADGADVNQCDDKHTTALFIASYRGHTEIVKLLLASHANPDIQQCFDGGTALMCAAFCGYRDITKLLIDAHADVNIRSKKGGTALILAANWGYTAIVKQLLEAGASTGTTTTYWYLSDNSEVCPANKEIKQLIYDYMYKNDGYLPWSVDVSCFDVGNEPCATLGRSLCYVGKFLNNYAKKIAK